MEEGTVRCFIDPKFCTIKQGQVGFCRVRKNIDGKLYSLNYGKCTSYSLDPMEKKPLYHFYPGSHIFSIGSQGCNFRCKFCQNWEIAHKETNFIDLPPEKAIELAGTQSHGHGSVGIAYTYSEPSVWYEYVYDTAYIAKEAGLKNVLVTNGFINQKPLEKLLPFVDAMNIDVKGFSDSFYKKIIFGQLEPVRQTVELAAKHCHVEVTTLIIPGLNDSEEEMDRLTDWLASVDKTIPLHITRFFPNFELTDLDPTPLETLERAREIALKKLEYVYTGNAWGSPGSHTYCPNCKKLVIERGPKGVRGVGLEGKHCNNCDTEIKFHGLLV